MADDVAAEFLESRGIYVTPVLRVDDDLLVGFQPEKVDRLLGITRPS